LAIVCHIKRQTIAFLSGHFSPDLLSRADLAV
jgi:hypothetical protein